MMKHNLLRCALFLLIFALAFSFIQMTLLPKWGEDGVLSHEMVNEKSFYSEPRNSMDTMVFGSCAASSGASPLTMYDQYGFTSYVRSSTDQPPYFSYYLMKDSLRFQQPKVFVLEMGQFFRSGEPFENEELAHRAIDYMRLSRVKLEAVSPLDKGEQLSYLLPFFRYHERWHDLSVTDFSYYDTSTHSYMKGQLNETSELSAKLEEKETASDAKLPEENLRVFEQIVSLCRDEGIELCLLKTPTLDWDQGRHKAVQALADKYGLAFLDYSLAELQERSGIELKDDLAGEGFTLSLSGAQKLSRHLGAYLRDTYQLADHREERRFKQWNTDLTAYLDASYKSKALSFELPVLVSASTDKDGITVTWEDVPHALAYAVYRKVDGGKWERLADVTELSYLDVPPEQGVEYFYTVKAVRGSTTGSGDATGIRITASETPQTVYMVDQLPEPEPEKSTAPVLLEVRPNADGIVFVWAAVDGAESYDVYRRAEGETDYVRVGKVFAPGFCDVTVQHGAAYTYTVKAIIDGRASDWDEQGLTAAY